MRGAWVPGEVGGGGIGGTLTRTASATVGAMAERDPEQEPRFEGREPDVNVVGGELLTCSVTPLTGFYRDGCCGTGPEDVGSHTVCAVMTEDFLAFSAMAGNDLSTPRPEWGFPGLVLGATHARAADAVPIELLTAFALPPDAG